jgi:limonene-1,2-epoxide hydrolase
MHDDREINRRVLLAGLGAVAAAGLIAEAGTAEAAGDVVDMSDVEKANVKVVNEFCKAWDLQPANAARDKMLSLMTEGCVWKISNSPAAVGRAAIGDRMTKFLANTHFNLNVFDTFAKGNLVVNSRIDSNIHPDSIDTPYPIVGVFFMKDGKINEWYELLMRREQKIG